MYVQYIFKNFIEFSSWIELLKSDCYIKNQYLIILLALPIII